MPAERSTLRARARAAEVNATLASGLAFNHQHG
jgi:hypothetical protein